MHLDDNPQPMHLGEEFLVAPGHILNPCQCRVGHASIRVCARTRGVFGVRVISRGWQRTTRSAFQRFHFRPTSEGTQYMRAGLNRILSLSSSNPGGPPCCTCLPIPPDLQVLAILLQQGRGPILQCMTSLTLHTVSSSANIYYNMIRGRPCTVRHKPVVQHAAC